MVERIIKAKVKVVAWFFTFLVMSITVLSMTPLFSNVKTTVSYTSVWWTIYGALLLLLFPCIVIIVRNTKASFSIQGGLHGKYFLSLAGTLVFALLAHGAVFSGVPTVLHYLTAEEGEMEVTIIAKEESRRKRACKPRLIIKEFTYWGSDFVCPEEAIYVKISVGDKAKLLGSVSSFGIDPYQIVWSESNH